MRKKGSRVGEPDGENCRTHAHLRPDIIWVLLLPGTDSPPLFPSFQMDQTTVRHRGVRSHSCPRHLSIRDASKELDPNADAQQLRCLLSPKLVKGKKQMKAEVKTAIQPKTLQLSSGLCSVHHWRVTPSTEDDPLDGDSWQPCSRQRP